MIKSFEKKLKKRTVTESSDSFVEKHHTCVALVLFIARFNLCNYGKIMTPYIRLVHPTQLDSTDPIL